MEAFPLPGLAEDAVRNPIQIHKELFSGIRSSFEVLVKRPVSVRLSIEPVQIDWIDPAGTHQASEWRNEPGSVDSM